MKKIAFIGLLACLLTGVEFRLQAQKKPLDTLHLFNAHADTIRLGFDEVLPLSATKDTTFHYLYRWFSNGKKVGEESVLNYSFTGERKTKVTGQRLFSALSWPGEAIDMEYFKHTDYLSCDYMDTVYLKAFSEYESDSTAKWIWIVKSERGFGARRDTLFGPKIKVSSPRNQSHLYNDCYVDITCTVRTNTEEKRSPVGTILFESDLRPSMRLTDSTGGSTYSIDMINSWPLGRIYAHEDDTLYLDGKVVEMEDTSYQVSVLWHYRDEYYDTPSLLISFDGSRYRERVYFWLEGHHGSNGWGVSSDIYVYWDIDPDAQDAQIESDSVWVFFPQYPCSNLGGRVDICLPPDAPLPSASDTVYTFNLGPWNRELEYVEYAWYDGTKTASGADSVVGTDSVFAYTFGKMDSVSPELYAGTLVTRVAADSLWQDSCGCFVKCTDDACHSYDTVRIYLHRLPSLQENVLLPRDSVLCAHLDLDLRLPPAADAYRCYWLDKDSIELPYGHDTARYTVEGMRGLDGFGAGTDTREPRFFQLRLDHKLCGVSFFDTLLVYDQVKPTFTLPCHDTLICRNEPVELDSLNPFVYRPFYGFEWNDGKKGSDYSFTDSGTYVLSFFVDKKYDFCGYTPATDTIRVIWVDPAMTDIFLPSDTAFCKDLSITLDVRVPYPSTLYSWQDGPMPDPEEEFEDEQDSIEFTPPFKVIKEEGTYNVLLLDSMNCRNRQEINVTVDACKPALEIPNVFTPNGDGVNDVLKFKQLEKCTDVLIEIVDRWGQPVLKKKVPTADGFEWNGRVNNTGARLPDGPYFYMVTYKNLYGKRKVQSGSITILGTSE